MTDRDDYLWDGSGTPDPDIVAMEEALAELRFDRPMPQIPDVSAKKPSRAGWWLAAAAVLALIAGGIAVAKPGEEPVRMTSEWEPPRVSVPAPTGGWAVARVSGAPTVSGAPLGTSGRLPIGEWLVTDGGSRARVEVADIGKLEVAPESRLRLVETGHAKHRLELERGSIHARVDAPPRLFVVDTPAASAVDLGCEYTLEVAEDGGTILEVTYGWVALEAEGMTAYVPEGAKCRTGRDGKIGIPHASDAPRALVEALDGLAKSPSVDRLLAVARADDRVSLWHVLWRSPERAAVYRKMRAQGAAAPKDEAGVLRGDAGALLAWGESLGLAPEGGAPVWR